MSTAFNQNKGCFFSSGLLTFIHVLSLCGVVYMQLGMRAKRKGCDNNIKSPEYYTYYKVKTKTGGGSTLISDVNIKLL